MGLTIETPGVAVITGASSGIGKEAAFLFAEAGAQGVVFGGRNIANLEAAAEESKKYASNPSYRPLVVVVDVTSEQSVQALADAAVKEFGRIDYGVNSAGMTAQTNNSVAEASMDEFDLMVNVNLKGTVLGMKVFTQQMLKQEPLKVTGRGGERSAGRGSIVNVSSGNGYIALPNKAAYTASKFAVIGATKTAALETGSKGVRVNAVCPGPVHTPMMDAEIARVPQMLQAIQAFTPMGRMAEPEEIAQTILHLCSSAGSFINGTGLLIDGGIGLGMHTGAN